MGARVKCDMDARFSVVSHTCLCCLFLSELVKFAQAYLIDRDCQMRYESISEYGEVVTIPSQARTSNLNEELVRPTRDSQEAEATWRACFADDADDD